MGDSVDGTWMTPSRQCQPHSKEAWHGLEGVFRVRSTLEPGESDPAAAPFSNAGRQGVRGQPQDRLQVAGSLSAGSDGAAGGSFTSPKDFTGSYARCH